MRDASAASMAAASQRSIATHILSQGTYAPSPDTLNVLGASVLLTAKGVVNTGTMAVAGLAGIGSAVFNGSAADGARMSEDILNRFSFAPQSAAERQVANAAAALIGSKVEAARGYLGDTVYDLTDSSAAAALAYAGPESFMALTGATRGVNGGLAVCGEHRLAGQSLGPQAQSAVRWGVG